MSSSAQRDDESTNVPSTGTDGNVALKKLAAERLAAHRSRHAVVEGAEVNARRQQAEAQAAIRLQARREADGQRDALRVREAVAARYEHSPSYKEFLAEEARRSVARAQAEAEVASRNAVAVEEAQRKLLEEMALLKEIEQWGEPAGKADAEKQLAEMPVLEVVAPETAPQSESKEEESPRDWRKEHEESSSGFAPLAGTFLGSLTPQEQLQVRLPEEAEWSLRSEGHAVSSPQLPAGAEEIAELDEEIEFRLSPEFPDLVLETQAIPGNIIEFPRELVAPRKARPRLAEGPLLADGTPEPQLRIFEVEPEHISAEPEVAALAAAPEWQGLLLGAGSPAEPLGLSPQLETQLQMDLPIYAAPVTRRALAATIDSLCVAAGLTGFAAVVMKIAGPALQPVPRPLLVAAIVGTFLFFTVIYRLLFFTLNDVTPGMRMTRMAFCTFRENSPSRRAIRRRLISTTLAACPLGLGLVWMLLDSDGLGWHDRMSRMYPRTY